ncbi:DUF1361 domain-containing protein [Leptobacterium flavescens]|uniref:DUF1361 domain-containing protein n=1 Tax=Leptobacterium flavescens TaxID=472055 RepID=A0A6P0UTE2_9FLAO|nr:DUF1361 domain-containing protein [Leptobacterium flavescens]NER15278.1 DUF1361 domain-containing protein [Leptobacterium flavescens]
MIRSKIYSYSNIAFSIALFSSLFFSFLLLFLRIQKTHSLTYSFLAWNLFLAAIPFFIVYLMRLSRTISGSRFLTVSAFFLWLLFLPNAPYIITDLMHLAHLSSEKLWFDVLLIASFAWNGLILGILSMLEMKRLLLNRIPAQKINLLMMIVSFLCGFGIYLGRFARYNSWDALRHPRLVLGNAIDRMFLPVSSQQTWSITLSFGLFIFICYLLFNALVYRRKYAGK